MGKLSTMIHLEPEQKTALQQRARERESSMAAEIRNAVDQYLSAATSKGWRRWMSFPNRHRGNCNRWAAALMTPTRSWAAC